MTMLKVAKSTSIDASSIRSIRATSGLYLGEGICHYVEVTYLVGSKPKEVHIFFDEKHEAEEYASRLIDELHKLRNPEGDGATSNRPMDLPDYDTKGL